MTLKYRESPLYVNNEPPIIIPLTEPDRCPKRFIIIAPKKPLGSFLTATMNFSGRKAKEWMTMGYQEGRDATARIIGSDDPTRRDVSN